jgi:hypothetical protein
LGGGGGGQEAGMKGDIESNQCGIPKNTSKNGWLLLLFDIKIVKINRFLYQTH